MEELHEIQYDGKTYKVYEPTIDIWSQLMVEKMFSTDFELALTLLSYVTGLSLDEIKQADAKSIINAADGLIEYYTGQGERFYETFEFNGKKFRFIDIPSLSFGEYIDIDDLLKLPETERHRRLNELLALLYREVDENGDYLPYDIKRIKDTALTFKKLPIKYLNSSLVFFYSINNILNGNIRYSFYQKEWWMIKIRVIKRKVKRVLDGTQLLFHFQGRTFLTPIKWCK